MDSVSGPFESSSVTVEDDDQSPSKVFSDKLPTWNTPDVPRHYIALPPSLCLRRSSVDLNALHTTPTPPSHAGRTHGRTSRRGRMECRRQKAVLPHGVSKLVREEVRVKSDKGQEMAVSMTILSLECPTSHTLLCAHARGPRTHQFRRAHGAHHLS